MRHTRRSVVALLVATSLTTGCTVSTNEEPVAIGDPFGLLEPTTTTSTTTPQAVTKGTVIYFLRSSDGTVTLTPVTREVDVSADVQEVMGNLFTVRPDGAERPDEAGLTSAIPESAVLLGTSFASADSGRLIVDVRGLFGNDGIQGNDLRNALAQIVWTATENVDVREISFRNNGAEVDAIVGNGRIADGPVNRNDYQALS